jgi:uncharacterized SAM-binding protein YcdF (DUF218 family)
MARKAIEAEKIARINGALFAPLERAERVPALTDAQGRARTATLLLGCRSITPAVVERHLETYRPGDKVIVAGGWPMRELSVAFGLACSGKLSEVFDWKAEGAWKRFGLKDRFLSHACTEAEYMKRKLLAGGVRAEDIVLVEGKSRNTGANILNCRAALEDLEGVRMIGFYPSMMRALMTARHNAFLDRAALSVEGVGDFGVTPGNWHEFGWLAGLIEGEYAKIQPAGFPGSYMGVFCAPADVDAEAVRVRFLKDTAPAPEPAPGA